jgi:HAD superfamily hydrolase (TIGR01509 family)
VSNIRAIVFDMDGVLIDAKEWHFEAFNRALELFGHTISRFEHTTKYDGLPTREKLRLLSLERGFPWGLHRVVNRVKQLYTLEIAADRCAPNPGHIRTLYRLKQDGFLVGLASNSIRRTVDVLMQKSQLDQLLSFTISNEDVARAKPDPEIYEKAMQLAGVTPDEMLVVEDNVHGIAAAEAAGAHVLQVDTVEDVNYPNIRACLDLINRNRFRRVG